MVVCEMKSFTMLFTKSLSWCENFGEDTRFLKKYICGFILSASGICDLCINMNKDLWYSLFFYYFYSGKNKYSLKKNKKTNIQNF